MMMQKIMRNGGRRWIPLLRKMQSYRGLSGCAIALASRATVISEVYIPSPIQVSMRNALLSCSSPGSQWAVFSWGEAASVLEIHLVDSKKFMGDNKEDKKRNMENKRD